MGTIHRSGGSRKTHDGARLVLTTILGVVFGFFVGVSFPSISFDKIQLPSGIMSSFDLAITNKNRVTRSSSLATDESGNGPKIYVPTNPRGAELLPPGIVAPETDLYLRRLWGEPSEDLKKQPKYLITFTVGYDQRNNINAAVKKFSEDFQILLFHYDGRTTEWDEFEWSRSAIHISTRRQTKWWYAKRFLHPDVVAAYEYIFIWDEDLGVEHFNGDRYIELVKKHGLEISQPGLEPNNGLTWQMTKRRGDREVHKITEEKPGWCSDPLLPPCAAFVEIMAPVFSRDAWRCVWYMIQLLHNVRVRLCTSRHAQTLLSMQETCTGIFVVVAEIYPSPCPPCKSNIECFQFVHQYKDKSSPFSASPLNKSFWKRDIDTISIWPGLVYFHLLQEFSFFKILNIMLWRSILQNDLVHGWGLDFALRRCVEPAHEKIGVVDSQWIIHQVIPSLGGQGKGDKGKAPWEGVRERCRNEWSLFQNRLANADRAYLSQTGKG